MKILNKTFNIEKIYRDMVFVRNIEQTAHNMYMMQRIRGFCHLSFGQEAIIAGICHAMERGQGKDELITTYRCHGYSILLSSALATLAELLGDLRGSSKGKGGSMHISDPVNNFWGGHGIVGVTHPLGAGIAFAKKYNEDNKNIAIAIAGDGAMNQGQLYEVFNMSALWELPVLFVIENNMYGMGTSIERCCANSDTLHKRAEPFGIIGEQVDGMDIKAVIEAFITAKQSIIQDKKPRFIEFRTYRYCGHSMSDPGSAYRTRDEVNQVKHERDPITNCAKLIDDAKVKKINDQVDKEVESIVAQLEEYHEPGADELFADILLNK